MPMPKTLASAALVITTDGLAETLDMSVRSIHRLLSGGKIPKPSRLGGQLRWSRAEIEEWIQAGMPDRKTWERMRSASERR